MAKPPSRVLKDHRKVGTRLIPPYLDAFPQLGEVPHVKVTVPELLWIAALNDQLGGQEGARLSLAVAKAAVALQPLPTFATSSTYAKLSHVEWASLAVALDAGDRALVSNALAPLARLYPTFPLRPLVLQSDMECQEGDIEWLVGVLPGLFDNASEEAIGMMAGATYIAFCTDKLKVCSDTSLADFPEIEKYPETEKSMRVASAIRGFINLLVGGLGSEPSDAWPRAFWNRGLEIRGCRTCEPQ